MTLCQSIQTSILDTFDEAVIIIGISHKTPSVIEYTNPSFSKMYGYSRKELEGANAVPLAKLCDEPEALESFFLTINHGTPIEITIRCRRKNGECFMGKITAALIPQAAIGRDFLVVRTADLSAKIDPLATASTTNEFLTARNQELEKMATHDALTNLYNRRYFDSHFERLVGFHSRHKLALSVCFIDVDYFKQYNDLYGHIAGDATLKKIANLLMTRFSRAEDVPARYGGDEFVVVSACESEANLAEQHFNQLRDGIQNLALPHEASACSEIVTISVGLYVGIPEMDSSPQTLLKRADRALYKAKKLGRNCAVLHQEPEAAPTSAAS